MAPILPERWRAPDFPHPHGRRRFLCDAPCVATRDVSRRDDRSNKKSARRGTEHKNVLCCEIGDTGSARWHPVRPDRQFNMSS